MSYHDTIDERGTGQPNSSDTFPDIGYDESELIPCVRYGSSANDEATQYPTLRPVDRRIPRAATTASPIYYLTKDELQRQAEFDNPYAVGGSSTIANLLQDDCADTGRVRYPIIVESDSAIPLDEMALALVGFVEDHLGADLGQYTVWYSGGRSIHVHVAAFVDAAGWDLIKVAAEEFNDSEESSISLDTSIYKPKGQFRLPGVKHKDNGGRKVRVAARWSHDRIFRRSHNTERGVPEAFLDALRETIPHHVGRPTADGLDLQRGVSGMDGDDNNDETSTSPPIYQMGGPPQNPDKWLAYRRHNAPPVSPYANAEADDLHSVTVVRVMGQPFEQGGTHFVPTDVLGAIGGDGNYRVFAEHGTVARPLKLSGHDVKKWDYERPEYVVILGGKSRRSRIFQVDKVDAHLTMESLRRGGRRIAIRQLESWGYDTGSTGMNGPRRSRSSEGSDDLTEAAALQQQIERHGITSVDDEYMAVFRVSCRLLSIDGWNRAWEWIRETYGNGFDPEETHDNLAAIVRHYDYDHVTVPDPSHH